MEVRFHGAAGSVTGSMMEVRDLDLNVHILVDCGASLGADGDSSMAGGAFPFRPADLQALFLTHAHLDHCGRLLDLVARGFAGTIWCTEPTRDLVLLQCRDGLRQLRGPTLAKARRALADLERPERWRTHVRPLDKTFQPLDLPGVKGQPVWARTLRSSHLLGSVGWQFTWKDAKGRACGLVCFGDSGPSSADQDVQLLLADNHNYVSSTKSCDHLAVIVESTYGKEPGRMPVSRVERLASLASALREVAKGATLVVPAFAFGRTQDVLFDIACLRHVHTDLREVRVVAPAAATLAGRASEVYARHLFKRVLPHTLAHHRVDVRTQWANRERFRALGFDLTSAADGARAEAWFRSAVGLAAPPDESVPAALPATSDASDALLKPGTVVVAGSGMGDHGLMGTLLRDALRVPHVIVGLVGYGSPLSTVSALRQIASVQREIEPEDFASIASQALPAPLGVATSSDAALCYRDVRARVVELPGYGGHASMAQLESLVFPQVTNTSTAATYRHPDRVFVVHGCATAQRNVAESLMHQLSPQGEVTTPSDLDPRWYDVGPVGRVSTLPSDR